MINHEQLGDMRDLSDEGNFGTEYGAPPATDPRRSKVLGDMRAVAMSEQDALSAYGRFLKSKYAPKENKDVADFDLEQLKGEIIRTPGLDAKYVVQIDAMTSADFLILQELSKDLKSHALGKDILEEILSRYQGGPAEQSKQPKQQRAA